MTMRARRGMTLMELVIGITITGLMALAGAGAFASIIDHRRIIRESTVSTERAAALRDMIRMWIVSGQVMVQQGGGPRGLTRTAVGATNLRTAGALGMNAAAVSAAQASGDELTFTTTALNPSMLPNVRIRLYIDGDANTPETGLTMEYQPNTQTPLVRRGLDSTIGVLKVEFLDRRTGRWFRASEAATIQSRAVRITLLPAEGGRDTIPALLQVPMIFPIGQTNNQQGIPVP
jgi:prepilin-type N-terminal cleavage/methylation domain-containing protein